MGWIRLRTSRLLIAIVLICVAVSALWAATTGTVRGVVHDPEHRPLQGAAVSIQSASTDWKQTGETDSAGQFRITNVPAGHYEVSVRANGFVTAQSPLVVGSADTAVLHFQLVIATAGEQVNVTEPEDSIQSHGTSSERVVTRNEIVAIPGATRSDSLKMITATVPGATIVHNQLHVRGGHEMLWMVDGVPLPNTNIASNIGPQFDPEDVQSLDIQRGSYSAEFGDRAYGVFNVVPKAGFDRNHEAVLSMGYGSQNTTDDQLSFGDHTQKLGYYVSLNGMRTDAGLETPVPQVLHDQHSGLGGMGSLIYNTSPHDQVRVTSGGRQDWFQVPNTYEQQQAGVADTDNERDTYVITSWMHTFSSNLATTVSPFYHFNSSEYVGSAADAPVIPYQQRGSNYVGLHSTVTFAKGEHDVRGGVLALGQRDVQQFSIRDGTAQTVASQQRLWGDQVALFAEDQWRVAPWMMLNGGLRFTRFAGGVSETATDPRVGLSLRVPKVGMWLRAFYGRYYQAPPLLTVNGPTLDLAATSGFGFLPLYGERDEQMEFGAVMPVANWKIESDYFVTKAKNFFDHDQLGESNIFFPLTIQRALIRGWETTLRAPERKHFNFSLSYSHQFAQGRGPATGGLVSFDPPPTGYYYLDHDQRNTVAVTSSVRVPWQTVVSGSVFYGSGFLNGDGPHHLPAHTTVDLAAYKSIGERWTVNVTATNIGDSRYQIDNSNTFGGTHYELPRRVYGEVKFRWRY